MRITNNGIVKSEAQNWKKERKQEDKRRKLCNFLKQSIMFVGDKSDTGVHKQKSAPEQKEC